MNNSSGDPVSLEFFIFFPLCILNNLFLPRLPQYCLCQTDVAIVPLFPSLHCPTPPRGNICGKGHGHPLQYCSVTKLGWVCVCLIGPCSPVSGQANLPHQLACTEKSACEKLIYAQIGQIAFPSSLNHYHTASEPVFAQVFCLIGFFISRQWIIEVNLCGQILCAATPLAKEVLRWKTSNDCSSTTKILHPVFHPGMESSDFKDKSGQTYDSFSFSSHVF